MRGFLLSLSLCLFLSLVSAEEANSQDTGSVRGFVSKLENGEPIPDANVVAQNDSGVAGTSVTNNDGVFVIPRLKPGRYIVVFTHVSRVSRQDTVTVTAGGLVSLDVELAYQERSLEELEIIENKIGGQTEIKAGLQTVDPADMDLIPSPDVSGDVVAVLNALPGVVTAGDQGGQLYIRGGEPSQNLVMIDGILLYQPFHLVGFYSAFPSDIVSSADVYAGGFGARYGGRLSSVIDIVSRNGNTKRFGGQFSISPFIAGATIEGPLSDVSDYSFLLSGRSSTVERAASSYVGQEIPYHFNDFFGKIFGAPRSNARIGLTGIRTYDRGIVGDDIGITPLSEIRYENRGLGARYLYLPGTLPILAEFSFTASDLTTSLGPEEQPERQATAGRIELATNVTHYTPVGAVEWGLFARTLKLQSELGGSFQNFVSYREFLTEAGLYVGPKLNVADGMTLQPGLRVHSFPSKNRAFVEPRLRFEWDREKDALSFAAGLYHQEIVGINDRRDAASVFTAWAATPLGSVPRAIHVIAGYSRQANRFVNISGEVYFKDLRDLLIGEWTPYPRFTTRLQYADGQVFGLDLRAEVKTNSFYGYVNYGLSSVQYTARQPSLLVWFGTDRYRFRPAHDRRHQINVVATTTVGKFTVSGRWQFGSGLPYNRAEGFDGFVLLNTDVDVFENPGSRRVIYEKPFNGILPTYHRLDLSIDRDFKIGRSSITAQFSAINAYNRPNIFYLDVFTLRRADQFPFLPSLGIKATIR